jgi:hypothetical protein
MYLTGTVNTVTDLFNLIKQACTDNGYTVTNSSSTVSYFTKGGNHTLLELFSGSNYLGTRNCVAIPEPSSPKQAYTRTLPFIGSSLTYHIGIFENPDMFVLNLQFADDRAVTLLFGNINKTGTNSPITGGIAFASTHSGNTTQNPGLWFVNHRELADGGDGHINYIPFAHCFHYNAVCGNGLAGADSWDAGIGRAPTLGTFTVFLDPAVIYPFRYSPNTWNNQAILLPYDLIVHMSEAMACCGTIPHIFLIRLDNYNINDVITIGSDQYKVFTWGQKNSNMPFTLDNVLPHTGLIGYCFKIN